ncbi:unnamed protein product [marine sediment metagenome]|uniref:Uncharacterized protein n=1 Tax=marine sediment metagenome TaxID=412755 RepID=X1M0A8_9ZZZZ
MKLTGFNHFIRSNAARLCAGLAIVADGPTSIGLPAIDPGFHFATSSYYQVLVTSYQPGAAWANETGAGMIVHAGRPQLATRNFFGGPWRYAGCVVGEASSPPAQQQNIAAPFTLTDDQIIWGFHQISMADGRLSTPSRYGPETIIESGP